MDIKQLSRCALSLGMALIASGCATVSPFSMKDNESHTTSTLATATKVDTASPGGLPAGWGTYINHEDHYTISYPGASYISIGHRADTSGLTTFSWSKFSHDSIEIENLPIEQMTLQHPLTPQQWINHQKQLSQSQFVTQKNLAINGLSGFLALDSQTQTVTVLLSSPSDYSSAYQLTFQAGSRDYEYPAFWQNMLQTFRLLPADESICNGSSCTNWN
jgi:hypothetical protein